MPSSLRVLTFTTLFPNGEQPQHGLFVRARIRELARLCELKVVAPVRWFPGASLCHRRYAAYARVASYEWQEGLEVYHPRAFTFPRIGKALDGLLLFLSTVWCVWRLRRRFAFDLIDAHWAFPDGFAAVLLGLLFRVPVTVTVRGDDLSVFPKYPVRRRLIAWTLRRAARVIAVCDALRQAALRLGSTPERTVVVGNGVDVARFFPLDSLSTRARLGLPRDRRLILSIGHLCERKGFHLIVEALRLLHDRGLSDVGLVVVGGDGEEDDFRATLQCTIHRMNLDADVFLVGPRANEELTQWYAAGDVFCLASSREGWPNVLLEALACGKPVVATRVWGTPEVIVSSDYGILVERNSAAIADGLEQALIRPWDKEALVAFAGRRTWRDVARGVLAVLNGGQESEVRGQTSDSPLEDSCRPRL